MAYAESIMTRLNPHILSAEEDDRLVFIEDVTDPDGRFYRVEYRCDDDGGNATAYCLYNPWGSNPYDYYESHLSDDGLICVGPDLHRDWSPYDLEFTVLRARFWCAGFSFLMEHDYDTTCRMIPDWRG